MTSTPAAPADIQQVLERFRAQFAEQLPARMAEAHERLAEWSADPASDDALRGLHAVLHRLAGSAGTFGLPALGEACRTIELQLDELLARDARTQRDVDGVTRAVNRLAMVRE
jgi:HPt (histidine-containing phosphotransfer) domain-containing protein